MDVSLGTRSRFSDRRAVIHKEVLENLMDYHGFKSAVNRYLLRYAGWDRRPVFYDIDKICPALRELERAYPAIRAGYQRRLAF